MPNPRPRSSWVLRSSDIPVADPCQSRARAEAHCRVRLQDYSWDSDASLASIASLASLRLSRQTLRAIDATDASRLSRFHFQRERLLGTLTAGHTDEGQP